MNVFTFHYSITKFSETHILFCIHYYVAELRGMRDESRPVPGQDGTRREGMKKFANLSGRDETG